MLKTHTCSRETAFSQSLLESGPQASFSKQIESGEKRKRRKTSLRAVMIPDGTSHHNDRVKNNWETENELIIWIIPLTYNLKLKNKLK